MCPSLKLNLSRNNLGYLSHPENLFQLLHYYKSYPIARNLEEVQVADIRGHTVLFVVIVVVVVFLFLYYS